MWFSNTVSKWFLFYFLAFQNYTVDPKQECLSFEILCVNHVIWTGRRILKLASNVEMFIYYFVYSLIKKKDESLCNFHNEITQPFLNLEGAPNVFHCNIKKPQQKKIIQYSTLISTFDAMSKWHDPHIKRINTHQLELFQ